MKKSTSGFTLIELLVVITVIVILAGISYVTYAQFQVNARDNKRKADISILQSKIDKYYQKNHEYPSISNSSVFGTLTTTDNEDPLDTPSWTFGRDSTTGLCSANSIRWGGGEGAYGPSCRNYGYASGVGNTAGGDNGQYGPGCTFGGSTFDKPWAVLSYYSETTKTIIFIGTPYSKISTSAASTAFPGESCTFASS